MTAFPDAAGGGPDAPADPHADRLRAAGLTRVVLPAGNEMGTVNAWIVDDDPLTLVDAGTRAPGAMEALDAALRGLGRTVADVGLVVLTHHHADHLGLVGEVVRRSGAEVAGLAPVAQYLEDYAAATAADRAFSGELLLRHGADVATVAAHRAGWAAFHGLAEAAPVGVPLTAGSRVRLRDRNLEVLARPGHSETDVLLVDADRRLALGGDHVLGTAPSVPVRDRPLAPAGPYVPGTDDVGVLLRYRASLRATRELPLDLVLPGHGPAFGGLPGVVDGHLGRQARDAERLLERAGRKPFTGVGLVAGIWPQAAPAMIFVLLSSVLGGLGLLEAEGRVRRLDGDDGEPVRFVAA
jgi:glyoxylase-like metal-dependent hydrolase (beta-lactamase superfamily II)